MHYQKHVFMCTNQKTAGKKCCADSGVDSSFLYFKNRLLDREMHGPGKIRLSQSGCLGRCQEGPCVVIYPEGVWYSYSSLEDLTEIIDSHLCSDKVVERLLISQGDPSRTSLGAPATVSD